MRSGLCYSCRRLQFFEDVEPEHCYGNGDEPGIHGLIGSGFWCNCPCRKWPKPSPSGTPVVHDLNDGDGCASDV